MKMLASWNVNGIRACVKKGYVEWLDTQSPDIVSLQETKAMPEQFPPEITEQSKYKNYFGSAQKKGYSGVLVQSQEPVLDVRSAIGVKKFDSEGRSLICEYQNFILINSYYPNGQHYHNRVPFKLQY